MNLLTGMSPSNISWVGTIASYLLIVTGVLSGPWFDLGYYKVMLFGGAALSSLGIFMLSLSHKYYQILLTQGICMGLGCGVLYIPGIALVSRSFTKHRAMAMGLVTSGAPVGRFYRHSEETANCLRVKQAELSIPSPSTRLSTHWDLHGQ